MLFLRFALGSFYGNSQNNKMDSLKSVWQNVSCLDTTRMHAALLERTIERTGNKIQTKDKRIGTGG